MPNKCPPSARLPFSKEWVERSIIARFSHVVSHFPDKTAVQGQGSVWTFAQLDQKSSLIAQHIFARTVENTSTVAFLLEHSSLAVSAILGILKAGKGYVPLDPGFPIERIRYMVEDSQAGLIITNTENLPLARSLFSAGKTIHLEALSPDLQKHPTDFATSPNNLAYILYSSGSTGTPKGIPHSQRNLLHHVWDHTDIYNINPTDRFALIVSFSFAASVSEIFGSLLNGGTLCLYDIKRGSLTGLSSWMRKEKITLLKAPISLFRIFMQTLSGEGNFPHLRLILLGGDTLYRRDVNSFRKKFAPQCVLANRLTSSETNSITQMILSSDMSLDDGVLPVGYPAHDKIIQIMRSDGGETKAGEVGEIVVTSKYIASGYWNKPLLTQERFSFLPSGEKVVYHTGDLGRLRPDGCLEHLGREDFMVKIRGFRVELAEITAVLLDNPTIEDAVIITQTGSLGEKQLVAYLVVGDSSLSVDGIREELASKLPEYMVPVKFKVLDRLPKTPTNKVDLQSLPR